MTLFDALDTSAPRAFPKWAAPAAGLLVAGAGASLGCQLPPHNAFSWPELFRSAAERVLLVFVACATTVWALCLVRSILTTCYAAGLRVSEVVRLLISDIDSLFARLSPSTTAFPV